ncbi:MAG: glycosyltransferase family 4 protein [Bacteroidales bacterium]|nr:glycosyltransferase family 4 protein [Bacteroidales bacterium]
MKILIVNTYDIRGGAARATWRLFEGLRRQNLEVKMLVQEKKSDDEDVVVVKSPVSGLLNPLRPYLDFAIPLLQTRKRVLFSSSMIPDRLVEEITRINPDVVHLNWITGGFVRIESLAKIPYPLVWTLHDMWAFTGGCHYASNCDRYLQSCGCCPLLNSKREKDLSNGVFLRKEKTYAAIQNLTITTPSRWLGKCVNVSPLLGSKKVAVIPNGLDTSLYRPGDKQKIRNDLGLPADKKLILFGAIRGIKNTIKGFDLLEKALHEVDHDRYELLIFGSNESALKKPLKVKTRFFGTITDEEKLVRLYNAADVVAVPSYQEVFGQAASEAMSCGTPVVAFAQTGLLDIVKHRETGYLATPFDPVDLARGIDWVTEDEIRYQALCSASRTRAVDHFSIDVVAGQWVSLYKEVMHAERP